MEKYGSQNYQDWRNDSSNHAKEGIGVPELQQALAKDPKVCPYSLPSGGCADMGPSCPKEFDGNTCRLKEK